MTQPPHIDGLPLWAQIVISLLFGLAALGAAYKGYFRSTDKPATPAVTESTTAHLLAASITDASAMRALNDTMIRVDATLQQLCKQIDEMTHHTRNANDLSREECARLRELREILERHLK